MPVAVYGAAAPGAAIKKQQQDVLGFLEANKIEFEEKDIALRLIISDNSLLCLLFPLPAAMLKDYDAFFEARENNAVYAFLGLTAPPGSKEAEALAKQQA
uniref:Uncharacterized protein n=1 Tax=Zonotrichia albicollis TaxID=44394 RepID=A0A8D2QIQ3_ZONAL